MVAEFPDDIFLLIFMELDLRDIQPVRLTCARFLHLTKQKSFWQRLLQTHINNHVPIPGYRNLRIETATAEQLENLVKDAQRLHENWTSASPTAKWNLTTQASTTHHAQVVRLHFLELQARKLLVTLSLLRDAPHQRFLIQAWDISTTSSQLTCVAQQEIPDFNSMAINDTIPTSQGPTQSAGIIAIHASNSITVYGLTPHPQSPSNGFGVVARVPIPTKRLHLLSGSKVLSSDEQERLYLWDIQRPQVALQLRNVEAGQHQAVLAAILEDDCIIVFRVMTLEVYPLPSPEFEQSTVIEAAVCHRWQWKLDSIAVTKRCQGSTSTAASRSSPSPSGASSSASSTRATTPIACLIRFTGFFPWPFNLLHEFVLSPEPTFQAETGGISVENSPYRFPPILRQTIAAPTRLFSPTDAVLGPYGTTIWIDNHTEDYFNRPDHGQRLASKVTRPGVGDAGQDGVDEQVDFEQDLSEQTATTMASSVLLYNDIDNWSKVGMDEEEGVVAIGRLDGGITVLWYR
ncbi:hypothetical protein FA15DRAFT_609595 [Coprinopsis marcescibilis]|uniref:F-box domain-containing protein n=1 Tax=Coprinopsis marcescibilis TaxID=230819 RepID=A0A5C3LA02_COPMA|nr:hypothetical protein FA15DRAFT_609595 [Coprinopsis marcescibilis]